MKFSRQKNDFETIYGVLERKHEKVLNVKFILTLYFLQETIN